MSDNYSMDRDVYIRQLEAENAALKQRIETLGKHLGQMQKHIENLERRLGMNSQNSSKPPSSDPPGALVALPRRRRRKCGARKGQCRRIFNQRRYLWTFVYDARVEPTNNLGEQAMREHVILRKIIGCFRSENGAENYQYIASLLASWRLQGKNAFVELEGLLRKELCLS